jgi:BRCA1-associated protein
LRAAAFGQHAATESMPSYFYHLKFELYPHPQHYKTTNLALSKPQDAWVPPSDSDIFCTGEWPSHQHFTRPQHQGLKAAFGGPQQGVHDTPHNFGLGSSRGSVIDCGPARASNNEDGHETNSVRTLTTGKSLEFPTPLPQRRLGDLETAEKDWRFGKVRIEGFDMTPTLAGQGLRPGHTRGESSGNLQVQQATTGHNGINAGLTASGVGRVTKAQYEILEEKNTEVGWGIVHLYRDGEETPALGALTPRSGAPNTPEQTPAPPSVSGLRMKDEVEGEAEDCTTLCIPAVPSYLTPSDFLGFVGEKTREQVSHFRMVMTGRMNRYLVLMKFRDNNEARRWRTEWDGKVFNSMEVRSPRIQICFPSILTFWCSQKRAMLRLSNR